MDEKRPLLRPLLRRTLVRTAPRDPRTLLWEILLSAFILAGLIFLGFIVHRSANPGQSIYEFASFAANDGFSWASISPSRTLEWHSCFNGEYDCARLDLPLDWLDPSEDERVIIAVARLRATETDDYRGPVFFNPGGPGGSGIWSLKDHGKQLQTIVGKNHDIITFDPRGIGASVPRIECWDTAEERHDWDMQETPVVDSHPGVLYDAWARAAAFSLACEQAHRTSGLLRHIGTASHVRDMVAMLDLLGGEGAKLRYWGFSYGTILGGAFAAMFPDRVGRLVSDGNVDYEEWFNAAHINAVRDADAIMEAFYVLCHRAGPEKCALYGPEPGVIRERHMAILERLRIEPVIYMPSGALGSGMPELVTYTKIRKLTGTSLYRPNHYFSHLAEILAGLERGDGAPYFAFVNRFGPPSSNLCSMKPIPPTTPVTSEDEGGGDAFPIILCADGKQLSKDPREFAVYAAEMMNISHAAGALVVRDRIACAGRTVRPKFSFTGPFSAKTSFPILYVANMADNITPLISARNNSAGFTDSVVLIQNSYGHTSLTAPSLCTAKAVHKYFQDGILPEDGSTCDPMVLPFDLPGSETGVLSSGEAELAAASRELSLNANWGLDKGHKKMF